jgi:hypothetical protein
VQGAVLFGARQVEFGRVRGSLHTGRGGNASGNGAFDRAGVDEELAVNGIADAPLEPTDAFFRRSRLTEADPCVAGTREFSTHY